MPIDPTQFESERSEHPSAPRTFALPAADDDPKFIARISRRIAGSIAVPG